MTNQNNTQQKNFWKDIPMPFTVLAPMENVTDFVFREIAATELSRPDVFFTEFTSSDGLNSKGYEFTIERFRYSQNQRPIVAQIWGTNPESLFKAAQIVKKLDFDGIDINMGCPDRTVMKNGAGAALIKNPALAKEIIKSVKEGVKDLPVSVKTRIGVNIYQTDEWIPFLLEQKISALTVHGRTAKQRSEVAADWNEIAKAVEIRNMISPDTLLIGNGDVENYNTVYLYHQKYGVDGIMVGRGIFKNPWIFEKTLKLSPRSKNEYIEVLLKHLELFEKTWHDTKSFEPLKKFFKMYINNFPRASLLRQRLMETKTITEARDIIKSL